MGNRGKEYFTNYSMWDACRACVSDGWSNWKDNHPEGFFGFVRSKLKISDNERIDQEHYSHIYRKKTTSELVRLSAAVMGIEFAYAAETAFVSPTLLKIGVEHRHMTLVWALSPLLGFVLTPILGSLSDQCSSSYGRRRPFILLLSLGVIIGLILVPNGESLGYNFGDVGPENVSSSVSSSTFRTSSMVSNDYVPYEEDSDNSEIMHHSWGIFFTILGTILLDFDADACQSPSRAYLLDVIVPEDHARGLSTFTIMAGLGGFLGYALGAINWDVTSIGIALGGHVRAVFTLILIIYITCVILTVTSFKEIPLNVFEILPNIGSENDPKESDEETTAFLEKENYGATLNRETFAESKQVSISVTAESRKASRPLSENAQPSLSMYIASIFNLPSSMIILCATNFFCWMAHVCYSLYFTDFVAEAVYHGHPTAPEGSYERQLYDEGVRFGCWGMSVYSLSCACYSAVIDKLIKKWGARTVYIGGPLFYALGMGSMALTRTKFGVIIFSAAAGIMYSTLFTMPYLLVANYHAKGVFKITEDGQQVYGEQLRGLGTDVAIVSSVVFLAQFLLSLCMGIIVSMSGTTTAVVVVASILAIISSICASRVMYLDL